MRAGNRPAPEFKREAVRLALTSGRMRQEVAADLGTGRPHQPVHQVPGAAIVVAEQNGEPDLALDKGGNVGLAVLPAEDHEIPLPVAEGLPVVHLIGPVSEGTIRRKDQAARASGVSGGVFSCGGRADIPPMPPTDAHGCRHGRRSSRGSPSWPRPRGVAGRRSHGRGSLPDGIADEPCVRRDQDECRASPFHSL